MQQRRSQAVEQLESYFRPPSKVQQLVSSGPRRLQTEDEGMLHGGKDLQSIAFWESEL